MKQSQFYLEIANNTNLFTQLWEPEINSKALILLIHGFGEHSQRYKHVAEALTKAGFITAAMDLRGHGLTNGPRGVVISYENEVFPDISKLLDTLSKRYGRLPTFLYGHSTGGGIVMGYALKQKPKIAGIISTSPWLTLAEEPSSALVRSMRLMKKVNPQFTNDMGFTENLLSRDPQVDIDAQNDQLMHGIMSAGLFIEAIDNGRYVLKNAYRFPLPLLLMHGTDDKLTHFGSSQKFANLANSEKVTFKRWPDAYHELHNDIIKDEVITFMENWVEKQLLVNKENSEQ